MLNPSSSSSSFIFILSLGTAHLANDAVKRRRRLILGPDVDPFILHLFAAWPRRNGQ